MVIPELDKPDNTWCKDCEVGKGCRNYEQRPRVCRDFFCGYISNPALDECWNPVTAHFILRATGSLLVVQVDPQRPDAWKREPYYSALRDHARTLCPQGALIIVKIGNRNILMLPNGEVDLGTGNDSKATRIRPVLTDAGPQWQAVKAGGERVGLPASGLPPLEAGEDETTGRNSWSPLTAHLR